MILAAGTLKLIHYKREAVMLTNPSLQLVVVTRDRMIYQTMNRCTEDKAILLHKRP
jgi:hypothetical protein